MKNYMKRSLFVLILLSISLLAAKNMFSQATGYYNGTENKSGEELKATLNDIISNHTVYSYFFSKEIFKLSDADPNNPANIIEIYTGKSWPNDDYGSSGDQLNREHIWAKSHGNFGDMQPMDGDVHNLKPCDASVNIDKSNLDYDNGGSPHPEATGCKFSDHNWEPRDQDKGDVARIIFYMDTRYEGENGEINLTAVDELDTYPEAKHGKLSTLLQWNLQDPPDDFERNRNNVIYSFQHNRNPFIDNPYFAELIWNNGTLPSVYIAGVSQEPHIAHAGNPVTINATIVSTAGNVTDAVLYYGTSWGNLAEGIDMTSSGDNFFAQIPAQAEGTRIYYRIEAENPSSSTQTVVYNFYVPKVFTGTLTSIYQIQGQDTVSPYNGQVVSTTGIVTANFGDGYFIQNGSGAWNGLYVWDNGRNPSVGDSIILTGKISEYFKKTEISNISGYYYISGDHPMPAPVDVTCAQAGEPYEGVITCVINATCTDDNYVANFYMWTVNDGTGDLLIQNTNILEYEPTEGEVYTITGPMDYEYDEWKMHLRLGTDVQSGIDVLAPQVISVSGISPIDLLIQFNEDVEETSAENIANYGIDNGITVTQARVHDFVKSQVYLVVSPLEAGSYNLSVNNISDLVGNKMSMTVIPFTATGLDEKSMQNTVRIFPNPADEEIFIEWPGERQETMSVNIMSVTGARVYSGELTPGINRTYSVPVNGLMSGLYMIEVRSGENIARTKIMIR